MQCSFCADKKMSPDYLLQPYINKLKSSQLHMNITTPLKFDTYILLISPIIDIMCQLRGKSDFRM